MSEEPQALELPKLSDEELLLLNRNADQFRHYINKKAKRLKKEAKARGISITETGEAK